MLAETFNIDKSAVWQVTRRNRDRFSGTTIGDVLLSMTDCQARELKKTLNVTDCDTKDFKVGLGEHQDG